MNPRWLLWTVRGLLLVALATSSALLVDYSHPSLEFCSVGSGCDSVRRSGLGFIPLGSLGHLPVPLLGIIGFSVTLAATLHRDWRRRRSWSLGLLGAGAFMALGFVVTMQWVIGHFCSLCAVVDIAAVLACALAFKIPKEGWQRTTEEELGARAGRGIHPLGWAVLAALCAAAPWLWPKLKPAPPVPPKIAALYQPGKINVVEFADFQCPYCRRLHAGLKRIMADYEGRVNFVRLHMPLRSHEHARHAAHAAVCASRQGKEDRMADALFEAPSLEPEKILEVAERLQLNIPQFERCLSDPATDRLVNEQASILKEAGFQGLPTTYVGATKIVGAQPEEVFREAFAAAASGDQNRGVPGWVYWTLVVLLGGITIRLARLKPAAPVKAPSTTA